MKLQRCCGNDCITCRFPLKLFRDKWPSKREFKDKR